MVCVREREIGRDFQKIINFFDQFVLVVSDSIVIIIINIILTYIESESERENVKT